MLIASEPASFRQWSDEFRTAQRLPRRHRLVGWVLASFAHGRDTGMCPGSVPLATAAMVMNPAVVMQILADLRYAGFFEYPERFPEPGRPFQFRLTIPIEPSPGGNDAQR